MRRVAEVSGRALVETQIVPPGADRDDALATATSVTAQPPRRTPTSFVTRFSWTGPDLPVADGVLTLTYVPGGQGTPSTAAELVLDVEGLEDSRLDDAELTDLAQGFLRQRGPVGGGPPGGLRA